MTEPLPISETTRAWACQRAAVLRAELGQAAATFFWLRAQLAAADLIAGQARGKIAEAGTYHGNQWVVPPDDQAKLKELGMSGRTLEQRDQVAAGLFAEGQPERAVAETIGVSPATAHRMKERLSGASYEAPARVTGADGKSYPARRDAS